MENNKLIAEFMKLPTEVFKSGIMNYHHDGAWYEEHELSYDVCWKWLMPVVKKIRKCKCYDRGDVFNYQFIIHNNKVEYYADGYTKKPSKIFNGSDIDTTYKSVVEFIKEYNK